MNISDEECLIHVVMIQSLKRSMGQNSISSIFEICFIFFLDYHSINFQFINAPTNLIFPSSKNQLHK